MNDNIETVKEYIAGILGVELNHSNHNRSWDGVSYNANINDKIIVISIASSFITSEREADDVINDLERFDILSFINDNPGENIFIKGDGPTVNSRNN